MIRMPKPEMDETDFKIAWKLKDNSRISYKTLGDYVSLSPSSVYERTKKMEDKEVIVSYNTEIDWSKFGYSLHAFILLKDDQIMHGTPDFLRDLDEVFNCWMISGEYDYMVEIHVANNNDLERLMNYFYENIGRTYTMLVIKNIFQTSLDSKD